MKLLYLVGTLLIIAGLIVYFLPHGRHRLPRSAAEATSHAGEFLPPEDGSEWSPRPEDLLSLRASKERWPWITWQMALRAVQKQADAELLSIWHHENERALAGHQEEMEAQQRWWAQLAARRAQPPQQQEERP